MSPVTVRTPKTNADRFTRYLPLASKLAAKYAAKYGLPLATLQDEAESLLAHQVMTLEWNFENKAKELTWVFRNLSWRLIEFCTRRQPRYATFSNTSRSAVAEVAKASARPGWWETLLANLGEDARVLAATLCNAPADLATDLAPRRAGTRGKPAAAAHMAGRGWDEARFERAWWEVAGAL